MTIRISKKRSASFLKKRNKKLLSIGHGTEFEPANSVLSETDKNFLVLFYKKEHLPFLPFTISRLARASMETGV